MEESSAPQSGTIAVVAPRSPAKKKSAAKAGKSVASASALVATDVPIDDFRASFQRTVAGLKVVFESADVQIGALGLDAIEVALSVSAEGHVGVLGTGGSVTGQASITVRFARGTR